MKLSPVVSLAARQQHDVLSLVRRRVISASPVLATTLLTAAIFLLPAPGVRQQAQASSAQVSTLNNPAAFR